ENRHHLAPGEGELGKAVQEEEAGTTLGLEAGFEHVHGQAVDAIDVARADGGGEGNIGEDGHGLRLSSPLPLWERVDRMSVSSSGALRAPPSPTRGEGKEAASSRRT